MKRNQHHEVNGLNSPPPQKRLKKSRLSTKNSNVIDQICGADLLDSSTSHSEDLSPTEHFEGAFLKTSPNYNIINIYKMFGC